MIVDTSALMAIIMRERGADRLIDALVSTHSFVPAPAYVEVQRVISRKQGLVRHEAQGTITDLLTGPMSLLPFTDEHAAAAAEANDRYGTVVAPQGTLNLLDLMVYACARVERRPILCTGRDFAATDAAIHPASRIAA